MNRIPSVSLRGGAAEAGAVGAGFCIPFDLERKQLVEACFPPDALAYGDLHHLIAFSSFPNRTPCPATPGLGPAGDCWREMAAVMNGASATAADWPR